jgi:hypothetical protein
MAYGNDEFMANGTVLSIGVNEWRVAGPMPVSPGLQLRLQVWPPMKHDGLEVGQATVLRVDGFEFTLAIEHIRQPDREWLTPILNRVQNQQVTSEAA